MCVEKKYLEPLLFSPLNRAGYEYQNVHCYSNHHNSLTRHLLHLRYARLFFQDDTRD